MSVVPSGTVNDPVYTSATGGGDASAANQVTGNNSLANIDTDLGAVADAAYASGSGSVISVLKGLFGKFVVGAGTSAAATRVTLSSDGPGVAALGTPTDAAATGDGSIIGVLKQVRALSGALGVGTAAAATRVTYASDGATVPVSGPVTDAQLRATAVPVSYTPAKLETTTRTPVWASGQHVVTSATTAKTTAITGTEVMISLSNDAYINIGTQSSITATKGAGSMFLKAGGPYTFQLTSGQGVAVIMDTAAGVMSAVPVA